VLSVSGKPNSKLKASSDARARVMLFRAPYLTSLTAENAPLHYLKSKNFAKQMSLWETVDLMRVLNCFAFFALCVQSVFHRFALNFVAWLT